MSSFLQSNPVAFWALLSGALVLLAAAFVAARVGRELRSLSHPKSGESASALRTRRQALSAVMLFVLILGLTVLGMSAGFLIFATPLGGRIGSLVGLIAGIGSHRLFQERLRRRLKASAPHGSVAPMGPS